MVREMLQDLDKTGIVSMPSLTMGAVEKAPLTDEGFAIELRDLSVYYDRFQAVRNVNVKIARKRVTAIIGPSGCGKSTLLRCFNRMNDFIPSFRAV